MHGRRRSPILPVPLLLLGLLWPLAAVADVEADLATCRQEIRRIGDRPRTPWEVYCLGLSYNFALNHKRDQARAVAHFRLAAEQGSAAAQAVLGYMLEQGYGTAKNPAEAFEWYGRAAAQDLDDGHLNLGRAYEHGIGTTPDTGLARRHYERAAALGSRNAREALAQLGRAVPPPTDAQRRFAEGAELYKAKKLAEAARIFAELARTGYAPAQLQIGYQLANGEGVTRNDVEAARWYRAAAEQGDAIAQGNLGELYENGRGVPEDWVEAARWYRASAEQGRPSGQFLLGRAFQFGIGVPQSRQEAIRWFDMAADKGDNQANYWAQNLKSAGNFIGFRTEEEQTTVIGGKLRTDTNLVRAEPRGVVFRHSGERMAYVRDLARRTDRQEALDAWNRSVDRYNDCKRSSASYCADPGPRP